MKQIAFRLKIFEGPLDLLLHLVSRNKVSIYDIPISEITEQYLEYMTDTQYYDIELSSEFLVMAAQLLYIKSRLLLPKSEDEKPQDDPRTELAERLALYSKIKRASEFLEQNEFAGGFMYYKPQEYITPIVIDEGLKAVTLMDLNASMESVYQRIIRKKPPRIESFSKLVGREPIPVHVKVTTFMQRLWEAGRMKLKDLFKGIKTRDEAVASFLAVLELMKMNKITVTQNKSDFEIVYLEKEVRKAWKRR